MLLVLFIKLFLLHLRFLYTFQFLRIVERYCQHLPCQITLPLRPDRFFGASEVLVQEPQGMLVSRRRFLLCAPELDFNGLMYIEIAIFYYFNRRFPGDLGRHRLIGWFVCSERLSEGPQLLPHPLYCLMCVHYLLVLFDERVKLDTPIRYLHLSSTAATEPRFLEGLDDLPGALDELLALAHLKVDAASGNHLLKINY